MKGIFNEQHYSFKDWPSFSADPPSAAAASTITSTGITIDPTKTSLDVQVESPIRDEIIGSTPAESNKSLAFVT